ncbi:MAG TPA: hypothetical protein PKN36_00225 [bacterium]|nr:hypothetical protein [bacterium]
MNSQNVEIISLVAAGISLILWIASANLFRLNRKKGIFSFILALIYSLFAGYYIYLARTDSTFSSVMSVEPGESLMEQELAMMQGNNTNDESVASKEISEMPEAGKDFLLFLEVGNNVFEVAEGDEIEINKKMRFRIKEVRMASGTEGIKADFKGFAGNARFNDLQDIGYWIRYENILKRWKMEGEKEKYEIQILKERERLGSIYIVFVN